MIPEAIHLDPSFTFSASFDARIRGGPSFGEMTLPFGLLGSRRSSRTFSHNACSIGQLAHAPGKWLAGGYVTFA